MNREEQTKKMMSEEYGKSLTGCLTAFVVVVLVLLAIGVTITLLSL